MELQTAPTLTQVTCSKAQDCCSINFAKYDRDNTAHRRAYYYTNTQTTEARQMLTWLVTCYALQYKYTGALGVISKAGGAVQGGAAGHC